MQRKLLAAAVAAALLAAGAYLFFRRGAPAPEPSPAVAAPPPAPPAPPPDAPLPPAAESDARVRSLFSALSPRPELQQWLAAPDLLERGAALIDNLDEDVSPRKQVPFLAPSGPYQPHRYERYDLFADVVASVDARALAGALRTLHPLLEAAYHRLGYPDRTLDAVLARALQRIVDAPLPATEPAVQPYRQVYVYADPKLEALGPVEKHLLRLGPRNERLVQDKARALQAALRPAP